MKKLSKKRKKREFFFFITGLSGSGKSSIAKKIKPKIEELYGKTLLFHGDEIRKIFNLKKYSKNDREKIAFQYIKLCKKITNENINVILATVSLYKSIREWNKKNFTSYIEIYVESDLKNIIKQKKKFFYRKKTNNVVGVNIKPNLPKKPNIIIKNNFEISINKLSDELLQKIKKIYKKK